MCNAIIQDYNGAIQIKTMERKEHLKVKLDLLTKETWNNSDIKQYLEVGTTTASKIHQSAIRKHKGLVIYDSKKVLRNAVLESVGLNLNDELMKIRAFNEGYEYLSCVGTMKNE